MGDGHLVSIAAFLLLPFCLSLAAFTDLFTMTIPNRVSLALLISYFAVAFALGMDLNTIGMSVVAGLVIFSICFALFALNVMGGGDAKLLTACALWFGFNTSLLTFMICVALLGGILTIAILLLRSRAQEIMVTGLRVPDSLLVAKKVPYGIAIAAAGLLTYPETPIVQLAMQHMM